MMLQTNDSRSIQFLAGLCLALAGASLQYAQTASDALETMGPQDAVTVRLISDPALDATDIKVAQSNGVVRLSGTVRSLLERERASDLAAAVRGVDEVDNQLEVEGADIKDERLRERIIAALEEHPATAGAKFQVNVSDGIVELLGTVETAAEARYAARVVRGIEGALALHERVTVQPAAQRPDAELEAAIESALRWDSMVRASDVTVHVRDGVVDLGGQVRTLAEKHAAIDLAAIPGVRTVNAYGLTVAPVAAEPEQSGPVSSSVLKDAVQRALDRDPELQRAALTASVENGTVTLSGEVDRLALADRAVRAAERITAVREVRSEITIAPTDRTDDALAAGIKNNLSRDPYASDEEIEVSVNDAVASLTGVVANSYEKQHATALATEVPGIRKVVNELAVEEQGTDATETADAEGKRVLPETDLTDSRLETAIREGLWWQPVVDGSGIDLEVEDGVVTLSGHVPSLAQAEAAVETAYIGGAVRVINKLEVGPPAHRSAESDHASTR